VTRVTVSEILEQIDQLTPVERSELIVKLHGHTGSPPDAVPRSRTGAEIVALLEAMPPIDFVDPYIEDPVEWVKAQRQKESDRLKPYWDGDR
jgi:hypothetical protein